VSDFPYFPDEEYDTRLANLRRLMAERDLDACLIASPENIFYLSGLSHLGFFAYHLLIVPHSGKMTLIARAMEHVTINKLVVEPGRVVFKGYPDSADQAQFTCNVLRELGLTSAKLATEKSNLYLFPRITEGIAEHLPQASVADCSGMVDSLRQIKSPRELDYTRQASQVTKAMMQAAIETAGAGVSEQEVAAETFHAMPLAGGTYPGFGPFIRSTPTLGEEHRTWSDRKLENGDMLFIELAGCVAHYHAPTGRLLFIGKAPEGTQQMSQVCLEAFSNVAQFIRPGVKARDVYEVWQHRVDAAGLSHYRRHHCGYMTGIGFPPSWTGGPMVVGLRHDSNLELQAGMVFHLMSWLMGAGKGDYFISDTAIITPDGCEVLFSASQQIQIL